MDKIIEHNFGTIRWCFNRLKAMNILEIGYRLMCLLRLKILRLRFLFFGKQGYLSSGTFRRARFFIEEEDIDFIRRNAAHKIKDGKRIENINYNIGFFSGLNNFKTDIRWRAGFSNAGIRKIWELNRFQWLVGYAQQYALERDESIAREIVYILKDWIEKNPALKGINWSCSMEASLRLLSWAWIYFLIRDSAAFKRDFEDVFLKSIYCHGSFIEANPSGYSSANNHLIGEGAGLFITGILFPQLKGADNRLNKGRFILEREIKNQVYPDGVCKEQSTKYHEFITDLYLLTIIIGKKNGITFSKDMYSRVEKMCEFLMHMTDKNGSAPSIGDSDDGVAMKLNIFEDSAKAVSILNTASVLFNRPDFKKNRNSIDEQSLWLLGYEGCERYLSLEPKNELPASKGFLEGGYYIMRHKDLFLSFDCGELGYLSLAAHGHADALGITLNVAGNHILVDPGTYLYHSDNIWRNYFRGTMAHNTVRIDRLDQSEIIGPFLWGYKTKSFLKYWSPNGGYDKVCGYHTGYTRLKDPVVHYREIAFDKPKGRIILKDNLRSKKRHFVELFFHLHPDCSLTRINKNSLEIVNKDVIVYIELDRTLDVHVLNREEDSICGWYSERFGEKKKTFTICAKDYFEGDKDFITQISVDYRKRREQ